MSEMYSEPECQQAGTSILNIVARAGPRETRSDGRTARPDVVVHRRGDRSADGNLLVVEFKNSEVAS